jgi:hypothetical protein
MSAVTQAKADIGDGILDLMIIGEIMQTLGVNGSDPEDSDRVTAPHVKWLGRSVSDLAARMQRAVEKLRPAVFDLDRGRSGGAALFVSLAQTRSPEGRSLSSLYQSSPKTVRAAATNSSYPARAV